MVGNKPLILHVDDNVEYLEVTKLIFKTEGLDFIIDWATSGEEALAKLNNGQNYDLLLIDYEMAFGMNGIELLKKIIECNFKIPILMLTGQGNEQVAAEAFKLGASGYFIKDVGISFFKNIITSIIKIIEKEQAEEQKIRLETCLKILLEAQLAPDFKRTMDKLAEGFVFIGATKFIFFERKNDYLSIIYSYPEEKLINFGRKFFGLTPEKVKIDISGRQENDYMKVYKTKMPLFQSSREEAIDNLIKSFSLNPKSAPLLRKILTTDYGCTIPLIANNEVIGIVDLETSIDMRQIVEQDYFQIFVTSAAHSILQAKRKEKLKNLQRSYENYLNLAQVGFFKTSIPDMKMLEVNDEYVRIFGYENVNELCKAFSNVESNLYEFCAKIISILKKKKKLINYAVDLKRRNGEPFKAIVNCVEHKEQSCIEGAILDISRLGNACIQ